MHIPRVSIGLPVYNGEKYLQLAVDSILRQDYADFELIISDNASTDATHEICQAYAAKDPRIRYSRNPANIGASRNYNRTFELARGEFFKWASHDDVHLPGFLSQCVIVLEQAPSRTILVAPRTELIDEAGHVIKSETEHLHTSHFRSYRRLSHVLKNVAYATAQFGLFRREALKGTRLIDSFYASDYVLLAEVALLGEIWEIPAVLFQRRFHPGVSTDVNKTWRDLRAWFDPSQAGHMILVPPRIRVGLEYLRSVKRMSMPINDRLLCYLCVFCVWCPREASQLAIQCRNRLALGTRLRKWFRHENALNAATL